MEYVAVEIIYLIVTISPYILFRIVYLDAHNSRLAA